MSSGEPPPNTPPDPGRIRDLGDLAKALNALRGRRSYAELHRAAVKLNGELPASTLSNMLTGKSVPTEVTLHVFLAVCGLTGSARQPWLDARDRVAASPLRTTVNTVRNAEPRRLGVHASIRVGDTGDELPAYVPREVDAALRTAIAAGGFVLARGSSSVGKSRSMYEAVRVVLPDWRLFHPVDAAAVRAFEPAARTVMWLDELQRYLDQPGGVPVGTVRALLDAGMVVLATLWPDEYSRRAVPRTPGEPDPYDNDRGVLSLAEVIDVPDTFTAEERRRAQRLAAHDRRLQVALDSTDAGLTQVLAAGPELVRWWEHADATDPRQYGGRAVITAALDARRLGAWEPLTRQFLAEAATAYLSPTQLGGLPKQWFQRALDYATTRQHGATSCLIPHATRETVPSRYVTADYLHQYARRLRRGVPVPGQVWRALVTHADLADGLRLADNAERRERPQDAAALIQRCADAGDGRAAVRLAKRIIDRGETQADTLEAMARASDPAIALLRPYAERDVDAAAELALLLAQGMGPLDEAVAVLTPFVDAGNPTALYHLAHILAYRDRDDLLRERADAGDRFAAWRLQSRLADHQPNRDDERQAVLERLADEGVEDAVITLDNHLSYAERADALRRRADAGDAYAAYCLSQLSMIEGNAAEAEAILRDYVGRGFRRVSAYLGMLLIRLGRHDEGITLLQPLVADGHSELTAQWADALVAQDRPEEALDLLREHVDRGGPPVIYRLVDLLKKLNRLDEAIREMQRGADRGDKTCSDQLQQLLIEAGRVDDALRLLRTLSDNGDRGASKRLCKLLVSHSRAEDLREEVHAGTPEASWHLRQLIDR